MVTTRAATKRKHSIEKGDQSTGIKKPRHGTSTFKMVSSDGYNVSIPIEAARLSPVLADYIEEDRLTAEQISAMNPYLLPGVNRDTIHLLELWLVKHSETPSWDEDHWWINDNQLADWYELWFKKLTDTDMFLLMKAGAFLEVKSLLGTCSRMASRRMKTMCADGIRELMFGHSKKPTIDPRLFLKILVDSLQQRLDGAMELIDVENA